MESIKSDAIRDLELKRLGAKKKLELIEEHMHNVERRHTIAVEEEWESTKDKSLSNATKRLIEVEKRLAVDEVYPKLRSERAAFSETLVLMRIDIDYLRRRHGANIADRMYDTFGWVSDVLNITEMNASEIADPGAPPRTG
jgi:hypothetical protein